MIAVIVDREMKAPMTGADAIAEVKRMLVIGPGVMIAIGGEVVDAVRVADAFARAAKTD